MADFLRLEQVSKRFGRHTAVDAVGFSIDQGELTVLVGPSASGKTTLLRLIAGLDEPTTGAVYLAGRSLAGVPPRHRNVAMVFQNHALYPHLSVYENIAFPLRRRGHQRGQIDAQVREAAAMLGIEAILGRKPDQLSGGQQQRVALGRALVCRPSLFLLDEPLASLDPALRLRLRLEIRRLQQRLRATMLYVTHDQAEALALADRLIVLDCGRVQQLGPPASVYQEPANAFVARFLGDPPMNLFAATVHCQGTLRLVLDHANTAFEPPAAVSHALANSSLDRLLVGIRPEHVRPCSPMAAGPTIAAEIDSLENRPGHCVVYGHLGAVPLAALAVDARPRPGERLPLAFDVAQAHFFRADTGARIA